MKKNALDLAGYASAFVVLALVVYALIHLVFIKPFYEENSYDSSEFGWNRLTEEKEDRFEGSLNVLQVENISGSVSITGWDQSHVAVKYIKSAPTQEHLDNLEVRMDVSGTRLYVKTVRKFRNSRGSVSFQISVPDNIRSISANSISGSIDLNGMNPGVDQDLSTISGSITTDNSADLDLRTISGSINFVFSGKKVKANSTSGRISGKILAIDDGGSIDIGAVSGSVALGIFKEFDASVKLHSVSGSVKSDFPVMVTTSKRNTIMGTIGEGRIPINIGTTSGSIRLTKL
jgi:DUF4097 and DUF4098 domain-containing protein YvlB